MSNRKSADECYFHVHAVIGEMLSAGEELDAEKVAHRVVERHPNLPMGPITLRATIRSAIVATREKESAKLRV